MNMSRHKVTVSSCGSYDPETVLAALPDEPFQVISPGHRVVLKPNWVMESRRHAPHEWEQIITHPSVITAVLRKVLDRLAGQGEITITDGPMTEASFEKLLRRYPVAAWQELCAGRGVSFAIVDLRDHEWLTQNGVTVQRTALPGDPRGKVLVDLVGGASEFEAHERPPLGYYGADYDRAETNRAHDGVHNLYSVSRTVIESDVFINLPKLKTHRKAGITCCLKNLVGINTYKNYLPHHSEGGPAQGGDQFPGADLRTSVEGPLLRLVKQYLFRREAIARLLSPVNRLGKKILGDSADVVRDGNWYGNDTAWRMILDLNKVLFYAGTDGVMRADRLGQAKAYIGVVDAVIGGDGDGPLAADPVPMGRLVTGVNPVAIDAVCATLMGFYPDRVPSIARAPGVRKYRICDFTLSEVEAVIDGASFPLAQIPGRFITPFRPQFGWKGYIDAPAGSAQGGNE